MIELIGKNLKNVPKEEVIVQINGANCEVNEATEQSIKCRTSF